MIRLISWAKRATQAKRGIKKQTAPWLVHLPLTFLEKPCTTSQWNPWQSSASQSCLTISTTQMKTAMPGNYTNSRDNLLPIFLLAGNSFSVCSAEAAEDFVAQSLLKNCVCNCRNLLKYRFHQLYLIFPRTYQWISSVNMLFCSQPKVRRLPICWHPMRPSSGSSVHMITSAISYWQRNGIKCLFIECIIRGL